MVGPGIVATISSTGDAIDISEDPDMLRPRAGRRRGERYDGDFRDLEKLDMAASLWRVLEISRRRMLVFNMGFVPYTPKHFGQQMDQPKLMPTKESKPRSEVGSRGVKAALLQP